MPRWEILHPVENSIDAALPNPLNTGPQDLFSRTVHAMSEENTQLTPKTAAIPAPTGSKTSAVPLKKETVRITLRARPGAGVTQPRESTAPVPTITSGVPAPTASRATAPIQLPSAPLPPPSPKAATSPVSLPPAPIPPPGRKTMPVPAVEVAAPTAPMAPTAPRPMAPGAPGAPRPMAPGAPRPPAPAAPAAPRVETGAMTQPMTAAPRPPGGGSGTGPLAGGAAAAGLPKATMKLAPTQPMNPGLPKATMKLSPTQPNRPGIAPSPPSAPVKRAAADSEQFYDEKDPDAGLVPLSAVCLVLALIVLGIQVCATDRITQGEESPIMVPAYERVSWETRDETTHEVKNKLEIPEVPN